MELTARKPGKTKEPDSKFIIFHHDEIASALRVLQESAAEDGLLDKVYLTLREAKFTKNHRIAAITAYLKSIDLFMRPNAGQRPAYISTVATEASIPAGEIHFRYDYISRRHQADPKLWQKTVLVGPSTLRHLENTIEFLKAEMANSSNDEIHSLKSEMYWLQKAYESTQIAIEEVAKIKKRKKEQEMAQKKLEKK